MFKKEYILSLFKKSYHVIGLIFCVILVHHYIIQTKNGAFLYSIKWDLHDYMWPIFSYFSDSLKQGIWPLWNPYIFAGTPIFSNLQTLQYNPLVLIYALTIGFSFKALQIYILLLFIIGAINIYILSRFFSVRPNIALLFGVLYSVSGFAIGNAQHCPQLHLFIFEPLTLYFLLRFFRISNIVNFGLAVFGVCILISCGYPSILGHLMVFNYLFLLSQILYIKEGRSFVLKKIFLLTLIFFAACIIMLPMLVPAFLSMDYITRGTGVSYDLFISHSLSLPYIISFFNPFLGQINIHNTIDDVSLKNCAVGFIILFLFFYSLFRNNGKKFLISYAIASFLGALGGNFFTGRLFYMIPFLSNSRHTTFEFRVLFVFIMYLISMISIEQFLKEKNKKIIVLSIVIPLTLYITLLCFFYNKSDINVIWKSFTLFMNFTVPIYLLKSIFLSLPVIIGLIYGLLFFKDFKAKVNILVCLGLIEAFFIAPANYLTVLKTSSQKEWHTYESYETKRDKGFPIPNPFKRKQVYPKIWGYGSIYKVHTDWGDDSTVLKSINNLVKSNNRQVLYGPFMYIMEKMKKDKKIVGFVPYQHNITQYSPNHISLQFEKFTSDTTVVLNFMHYPGWKAFVLNQERECFSLLDGFVGVKFKKGDSCLDLSFAPSYYYILLCMSLIVILIIIFAHPFLKKYKVFFDENFTYFKSKA